MIAKHSMEQSQKGEGVEVVENKPHEVIWLYLILGFDVMTSKPVL